MLHGNDVLLRLPASGDYAQWRDLREASRAFLTPWEPAWTPDELTRHAFRMRLRRYQREARERCGYSFFIFDALGEQLAGGITLGRIQRGVAQTATIGYWMGQIHAGQGIMYRALDLVKTFAFDVEGLHRLEAACLPSNARSIRLLEKSGFRQEGLLRQYLKIAGVWEDHRLYGLLTDDRPIRRGHAV
ncbi:GNAT family N-acetyltransferase [Aureimonas jatrophae]|uniref:Ribosomal-protein-alanine N-acetyltransferase n=1 Tax=Aureimonas jatrophae TaxID=1166073 RepID=A0A1H0GP87_9HYPH|nr:GNAT family protein [Aureimonas jatrophae]MBB3949682.1 ribosomal-protein-alanine N-acetyltransferase [Aureimonas jatrophae]SDO08705.1 ribosomal-protein-alanine N-acetyltransferase [Aureimonas jatrophae]